MSLAKMQGGVEIPRNERPWANRLKGNFDHLNPEIQGNIISIISDIRKENPDRALEIAHKIGDFFSHSGEYAKESNLSIQDFLAQLQDELERLRKKKIN